MCCSPRGLKDLDTTEQLNNKSSKILSSLVRLTGVEVKGSPRFQGGKGSSGNLDLEEPCLPAVILRQDWELWTIPCARPCRGCIELAKVWVHQGMGPTSGETPQWVE